MARLTLLELRTDLRDLLEEYQSAGSVTDTILNRLLNRSQRELTNLVDSIIPGYYETTEPITTTAGTSIYELPDDWRSTSRIENENGGPVKPYISDNFTDTSNTTQEVAEFFWLKGRYIWLYPTPSATGKTYTHYYYKDATSMSSDSSYADFPGGGFEQLIVYKAALKHALAMGAMEGYQGLKIEYDEKLREFKQYNWQKYFPDRVGVAKWDFGQGFINTNGTR
ncbi:MAG: hypothetical protein KKD77_23515 [Gammaproteobacteria bacterium]|nr:hypothetical protein [Gammaproteobacteria bacterium]